MSLPSSHNATVSDPSLPMPSPTSSLGGLPQLLKDTVKLPCREGRLTVSIILLLFPFSFAAKLNPMQLKVDLASLLPFRLTPDDVTNEFRSLLEFDLTSEAFWWLWITAGISSLSIGYITQPSNLAQVFRTLRRKWKRVSITSLYASLLSTIYVSLLLALAYSVSSSLDEDASLPFVLIRISAHLLTMIGCVVFVLVVLGCHLSLVITSVEEGCYGLGAVQRAGELVRGRKLPAIMMMGLLILLDQVLDELDIEIDDKINKGTMDSTAVGRAFAKTSLELVLMVFGSAFYSVFYLQCKRGRINDL